MCTCAPNTATTFITTTTYSPRASSLTPAPLPPRPCPHPKNHTQVEYIHWRFENAAELPRSLCTALSFIVATVPHATEPLWSKGAELLLGERFYKEQRARQVGGWQPLQARCGCMAWQPLL